MCDVVSVVFGGCCGLLPSFVVLLVMICALPIGVGQPASWVRCRDSRVVGHRSG
jgi:hypothetical protein